MPLRRLPGEVAGPEIPRAGLLSTLATTSVAEADELAQADARAEAARARATRLRQQADAASSGQRDPAGACETEAQSDPPPARRWWRRPSRKVLAVAAAVVVICAALTASGYLMSHHRNAEQQRQRAAEFAGVARNAIVTMLSVDASHARDDMQRFADDTTGAFKVGVLLGAESLVKEVEESKTSSKGTAQAVAVESMTKDSAVVLVAAKSELTKPGEAEPESRSLRVVVNVQRDGGQLKISKVEIVP